MASSYLQPQPSSSPAATEQNCIGGIVPHAGWICSGAVAGQTIAHLAQGNQPDVVVIFGAVHTPIAIERAALDTHSTWSLPTGPSPVARELERTLSETPSLFVVDERFHQQEHAVEVELPLLQLAFPKARILPVEVPAVQSAIAIGRRTAQLIQKAGLKPIFLASSDLTHYGPDYRFTPAGIGQQALDWAMDNDRRLLRLVTDMQLEQIVPEVQTRQSACGSGAIAAMLAACREFGASRGVVLRHTNSFQTLAEVAPQPPVNAVGYAAVVVS